MPSDPGIHIFTQNHEIVTLIKDVVETMLLHDGYAKESLDLKKTKQN